MNPNKSQKNTWAWLAVAFIAILGLTLFAWYLYLHKASTRLDTVSSGRGLNDNTEVFGTPIGALSVLGVERGKGVVATSTLPLFAQASGAPSGAPYYSSSSSLARFVDTQNGNVYDVDLTNGTINRITNTLISRVGQTIWIDSNRVILRALNDAERITTFNAVITGSTTPKTLSGTFLEEDIPAIVASPDGSSIARLIPTTKGVDLVRSKPDGSNAKRLWSSSIRSWSLNWTRSKTIFITSRPSAGISGSMYAIDADTGEMSPYIVDIPGLSAHVNPKTNDVVYSASYSDRTVLFYRAASTTLATRLPFQTLAEKCVWSTKNTKTLYCAVPRAIADGVVYPDQWHRGEFHTSDDWFIINVADNTSVPLEDSGLDGSLDVDVSEPTIDKPGNHIVFIDAKSGKPFIINVSQL